MYNSLIEKDHLSLMGITESYFVSIVSLCENASINERQRSMKIPIALLLTKLRTGMSDTVLSALYKLDKSTISKVIHRACSALKKHFVPLHFGTIKILFYIFENPWLEYHVKVVYNIWITAILINTI